jgi:hypothetical protein
MIISNHSFFAPAILIHKQCGQAVEKGFQTGETTFYSCPTCNAWVAQEQVEWKMDKIAS